MDHPLNIRWLAGNGGFLLIFSLLRPLLRMGGQPPPQGLFRRKARLELWGRERTYIRGKIQLPISWSFLQNLRYEIA